MSPRGAPHSTPLGALSQREALVLRRGARWWSAGLPMKTLSVAEALAVSASRLLRSPAPSAPAASRSGRRALQGVCVICPLKHQSVKLICVRASSRRRMCTRASACLHAGACARARLHAGACARIFTQVLPPASHPSSSASQCPADTRECLRGKKRMLLHPRSPPFDPCMSLKVCHRRQLGC